MAAAAEEWTEALASWAIPDEILAKAPEPPWHFPVKVFARRAEAAARSELTFSNLRAFEALPEGGTVLDVGCGGGAASLPLSARASGLIGVDTSMEMLDAFLENSRAAGVEAEAIEGAWPEVAQQTPIADVAVCHHVIYNASDLAAFALRLTDHARTRVVVELTQHHPTSDLSPLWLRFHGLTRPSRPTSDDAEAVLRELGLDPERRDWNAPRPGGYESVQEMVAHVRRLVCLPAERDPEIRDAIAHRVVERDGRFGFADRPVTTLWWEGSAS
ncbi:MAG TPA: class I SAM-dependent methyltransferase [Actinomycetota bacterium]|jgi:SAM-dependent methyltransferase